jgi:phosphoglycerol transferase
MKLWQADLRIPFAYNGDALFNSTLIKGIIDNGWLLHNHFVGMPAGLDMYDFPHSDNFHFLIIKLITLFTSNWAFGMNLFFLLGFPLTTVSALYVFRKFNFSFPSSIVGSLLYSFLPYHFFRGEVHLFLASHYLIPLIVLVILWIFSGDLGSLSYDAINKGEKFKLTHNKFWLSVIICILAASSGIYYAFFSLLFLFVAGASTSFLKKKIYPLVLSGVLMGFILLGILINVSPTLIYHYQHGKNEGIIRLPEGAEIAGMKIVQLLLPVEGHRVPLLSKIKSYYNSSAPLVNENLSSSLGAIGSVGFLVLIIYLFCTNGNGLMRNLSLLNISGVLFATIGGFGSFFAFIVTPEFRSLNRLSVFIAFFSLFAVVILLDRCFMKYVRPRVSSFDYYGFLFGIIILGILDQAPRHFIPPYASMKAEYSNDSNFISAIEASVPENSMIYQLPYVPFPENPPGYKMTDYDHFRAYLHSKTLRWSYGAMKTRDGDLWQRWATPKPLNDSLAIISQAGFRGIYIDRYGYPDGGSQIEKELTALLNVTPIVSDNKRLIFFDMQDFDRKRTKSHLNVANPQVQGLRKLAQTSLPIETKNIRYAFNNFNQRRYYIDIVGWAFIKGKNLENSKIYLGLRSDRNSYLINTNSVKRRDVTAHFKSYNYDDSGFLAVIAKNEIENGLYKVGIYIKKDNIEAFQYTDKVVKIENE